MATFKLLKENWSDKTVPHLYHIWCWLFIISSQISDIIAIHREKKRLPLNKCRIVSYLPFLALFRVAKMAKPSPNMGRRAGRSVYSQDLIDKYRILALNGKVKGQLKVCGKELRQLTEFHSPKYVSLEWQFINHWIITSAIGMQKLLFLQQITCKKSIDIPSHSRKVSLKYDV